jgi:hypothetical protein
MPPTVPLLYSPAESVTVRRANLSSDVTEVADDEACERVW